ncbi:DsbA family protein [Nonomuraea sp. NPDC050310]|uniref:mycothiol-dependent nitroreductase Rv2466c family protein n=1 Tax=Nonomuraea sp. NPDC050310 TaxID=3154935 RepID=UPI0033C02590
MIVDFWFDPSCPFTWTTSRWLVEAATVRPITIRWRLLSLAALNEHLEVNPEGDTEGYLWYPARICAAVQEGYGTAALGAFYAAFASRTDWDAAAALAEAGLPLELAEAATSERYDDELRASTARGIAKVGPHVGTPILAVGDTACFGPVLSRVPEGEAAGRLLDAVLVIAGTPGFHELKGPPPPEV